MMPGAFALRCGNCTCCLAVGKALDGIPPTAPMFACAAHIMMSKQLSLFQPHPALHCTAENDMRARGYIKQLMREAGLTIREDSMGNIYGVLPGANPGAASVTTGSHCDAIPLAGAYDGTLGALCCAALDARCSYAELRWMCVAVFGLQTCHSAPTLGAPALRLSQAAAGCCGHILS
jgi:hypothetical protein